MKNAYLLDLRHPTRKIIEVDAEIKKCEKWTWAIYNGRRHLLGSSAFFTEAAAVRSQIGLLEQVVRNTYLVHSGIANRRYHEKAVTKLEQLKTFKLVAAEAARKLGSLRALAVRAGIITEKGNLRKPYNGRQ